MQKIRSAIQPNIYECKFCGEHHCDQHDSADMQSVQEMLTMYPQQTQPSIVLQAPPPNRKAAYPQKYDIETNSQLQN